MIATVVAALLALLLSGGAFAEEPPPPAGRGGAEGRAAPPLTARAQLVPRRHATLSAAMAGRLSRFPVEEGARVEEGALLAAFDCEAEQAERAVMAARLDAARTQREVNERLAEMRNVSALDLKVSRSEEVIAKAELRGIDARLKRCELKAPFAGEVMEGYVAAHQYVKLGEPLLRLVDPASVEGEMVLPSSVLRWLRPGHRATLVLDELGVELAVEVDRIIGEIDPVSQTVRVTARLLPGTAGMAGGLLPGMSGGVRIVRDDERSR